jgi:tRNA pseudouridine55 synthase
MTPLNGVLPVDKPSGPTSHDIVAIARRTLGLRRIGHTGTLDPFATGLLLICLGPATRLAEYLSGLRKSYIATMRLGVTTTTDDPESEALTSDEGWRDVDVDSLRAALQQQTGDILQIPSSYSAKKVGGRRMYDVARSGGVVDLEPVPVTVSKLELLRYDPPDADFVVECSSGTYVRAIARDVGAALRVGAHLTRLRRTRIGDFDVESALSLDELADPVAVEGALVSPAKAIGHLPRRIVSPAEAVTLSHGGRLARGSVVAKGSVALVSEGGDLLAIGEVDEDLIHPRKVFL